MKRGNYTDGEILNGIQRQDNNVILFVYRKNFRSVKYYVEQNNGTDKDAEDVFQEAMILVFTKARTKDFELRSSFHTYLFSVVKIFWLRQLSKRQSRPVEIIDCDSLISEDENLLEAIVQTERRHLFLKHYNELSSDCQRIIKLFIKGFSITQITEMMGYSSEQHTKNRRFRCKKTLLKKIILNPYFKELANGTIGENYQVPRW
jgi:RNA polymerase sigma factor (sigma-70 family)